MILALNLWQQIGQLLSENWLTFLKGLGVTLLLAVVGTVVGLILGIGIGLIRNLKVNPRDNLFVRIVKRIASFITMCYVQVFRGTPMMVQAMIFYFGVLFIGGTWPSYLACGLIVISLNTAAYMAEIIRSGINSVDVGQMEAGRSLGMNYVQTMIHVIMPQALKNSIPTIGNEFIVNIKDSSVLNVISVTELYASVSIATNKNYFKIAGYIIIAIIYLVLTLITTQILKLIEKQLDAPHKVKKFAFKHEGGSVNV